MNQKYELFREKGERTAESGFRRYRKKLIDRKLIRREFTSRGFRGRSSKSFLCRGVLNRFVGKIKSKNSDM
ncbi:MAG: hypothetical protein A7316_07260 [Candidatus Altiarchaeales archaeon WOR_SM1_86-2]|nr:MAG: hypothetical protein A7315_12065 [Candidatus Altiarchaeales archaeon WOR_SM1_79]ODS38745.1 MAG: hypothetical protein A7316_07260 [Candidatus Altiarchaeales archaeon WOR_SM1_86-2]